MIDAPVRSTYTFHNTDLATGEPGWLSPSSIVEFLRCSFCWKLNRIDHLPRPIGINLIIGSSLHKATEQMRLAVMEANSPQGPDPMLIAADHFDQESAQPLDEETGAPLDVMEIDLGSKYTSLGEAKDHAVALARFAVPKILALDKQRGKIAAVEYNLSMLDVSPYPFAIQGRIDAAYVDWLSEPRPEDATIMADLKSSSRQAAPDEYVSIGQSIYEEFFHYRNRSIAVLADVVSKGKNPDLVTYPLSIDGYGRNLVHQTVLEVAEDISAGRFRMRPNFLCPFIHGLPEFQVAVSGFLDGE